MEDAVRTGQLAGAQRGLEPVPGTEAVERERRREEFCVRSGSEQPGSVGGEESLAANERHDGDAPGRAGRAGADEPVGELLSQAGNRHGGRRRHGGADGSQAEPDNQTQDGATA